MALFGHSGSHAPQLIHSLVIIVAMNWVLLQVLGVNAGVKKRTHGS
jgi:hypothetical protein